MPDVERGGLPFPISTAVNIVNPFPDIALQTTGIFGIWTAYDALIGKGVSVRPSIWTAMLGRQNWGKWIPGKGLGSKIARGWLGGIGLGGGEGVMKAAGISMDYRTPFMKAFRSISSKWRWRTFNPDAFMGELVGKIGGNIPAHKLAMLMAKGPIGRAAKAAVEPALIASSIGSVALPIIAGITAGKLASDVIGLTFKAGVAAMNTVSRVSEQIRGLEFGGGLGPGYMMGAAKTERSRAVKEIQRSHLNGRRMMGRESELYAGIV